VAILLLVAYDRAEAYGAKHADTSRTLLTRDGILPVCCRDLGHEKKQVDIDPKNEIVVLGMTSR